MASNSDKSVSGTPQLLPSTGWIAAAFGAGTTALWGLVSWFVAGDAFIGMALSLFVITGMGVLTEMDRGVADAE